MISSVYRYIAASLLLLAAPARGDDALERLKTGLAAAPSATEYLTQRCASLKLAAPPVIKAVRQRRQQAASAKVRELLQVAPDTPLGYRRVLLTCGIHILSQADNWFVPARLTPDMNQKLDTGDTPFGAVVKPLDFHRVSVKTERLDGAVSALRVTALLETPDGRPFSLVVEDYSRELTAGDRR